MSGDSSEEKQFLIVADTRRRWTRAEKQSIVGECAPGKASVSATARKHNIAPNLLFRWRRELSVGDPEAVRKRTFVPVALVPGSSEVKSPGGTVPWQTGQSGLIEIELVSGHRLRVDGTIDAVSLRRVIAVLEGR